jgi:hypothetical protein
VVLQNVGDHIEGYMPSQLRRLQITKIKLFLIFDMIYHFVYSSSQYTIVQSVTE